MSREAKITLLLIYYTTYCAYSTTKSYGIPIPPTPALKNRSANKTTARSVLPHHEHISYTSL